MPITPDMPGQLIDELCDSFEDGWLSGTPVPLERVVQAAPETVRAELFRELLAIEGEYRSKARRPITAAEARERFARLGPWAEALVRDTLAATSSWGATPPAAAPPDVRPRARNVIGRYELLRELGHGAHGTVYQARHTQLKRLVALKVLFPHRAKTADGIERFHREMEVLGKLRHPHVVAATDAGQADGYHYLAMEFVDGADLGRVLRQASRLAVPDACEVVRQAAEGLDYIGRNAMVHRDIKPSYLLLGRDGVVRVVDLGLVRWDKTILGDQFTLTGEVMGTTDFIAPEQALQSRDADIRADVYSLGCTLYALLTGAPPFAGVGGGALHKVKAHAEAAVPPLAPRCPDAPAGLVELLRRMLEKDPDLRPQSPAEVARDIAPFCPGHALPRLLPPAPTGPAEAPALPQLLPQLGPIEFSTSPGAATETYTPERRPRRPWRFAAAGTSLALAAGALWFALKPELGPVAAEIAVEDRTADAAGGIAQAPMPRVKFLPHTFKPGEWCELLDRDPTVLAWAKPDRDSECRLDDAPDGKKLLRVNCPDVGMLQFADVESDSGYELEVAFHQNPWIGGVGVFARGRSVGGDKPHIDIDYLMVERFEQKKNPAAVTIDRGRGRGYSPRRGVLDGIKSENTAHRATNDHRLTLVVGPRGLETLFLDGDPVPGAVFPTGEGEVPRDGPQGSVGVLVKGCCVVIQSVRIKVRQPPENR